MTDGRKIRRDSLRQILKTDPFLTDCQLAEEFGVSVATIRLDRMAMNIPELRERTKDIASGTYTKLRSLRGEEVIGDLIDLELGKYGVSILIVNEEMVFEKNRILRGHFLFAQGNSLAVAVVNAEVALTATARVRFYQPVYANQRVVSKANVESINGHKYVVSVDSKVQDQLVFRGEFVVVDVSKKQGE